MSKKSFRVGGPVGVGRICEVVGDRVGRLGRFDVGVKLLDVHDGDGSEDGDVERDCSKVLGICYIYTDRIHWHGIKSQKH